MNVRGVKRMRRSYRLVTCQDQVSCASAVHWLMRNVTNSAG